MNCKNGHRVTVPGLGAVLVAFANQALVTGNSTIAAIGAYMSRVTSTSLSPYFPGRCSGNPATCTNGVTPLKIQLRCFPSFLVTICNI